MKRLLIVILMMHLNLLYAGNFADFLLIDFGAKNASLGGSGSPVDKDVTAILNNPAGLSYYNGFAFSFSANNWIVNSKNLFTGFINKSAHFNYGIGILSIQLPSFYETDEFGVVSTTPFRNSDNIFLLSFARMLSKVSTGITLKLVHQKLLEVNKIYYCFDFGLMYEQMFHKHNISRGILAGFNIQNIGPEVDFYAQKEKLPFTVNAGIKYSLYESDAIGLYPLLNFKYNNSELKYNLGIEAAIIKIFYLRGGYRINSDLEKITYGIGMRYCSESCIYEANYSIIPDAGLGKKEWIEFSLINRQKSILPFSHKLFDAGMQFYIGLNTSYINSESYKEVYSHKISRTTDMNNINLRPGFTFIMEKDLPLNTGLKLKINYDNSSYYELRRTLFVDDIIEEANFNFGLLNILKIKFGIQTAGDEETILYYRLGSPGIKLGISDVEKKIIFKLSGVQLSEIYFSYYVPEKEIFSKYISGFYLKGRLADDAFIKLRTFYDNRYDLIMARDESLTLMSVSLDYLIRKETQIRFFGEAGFSIYNYSKNTGAISQSEGINIFNYGIPIDKNGGNISGAGLYVGIEMQRFLSDKILNKLTVQGYFSDIGGSGQHFIICSENNERFILGEIAQESMFNQKVLNIKFSGVLSDTLSYYLDTFVFKPNIERYNSVSGEEFDFGLLYSIKDILINKLVIGFLTGENRDINYGAKYEIKFKI